MDSEAAIERAVIERKRQLMQPATTQDHLLLIKGSGGAGRTPRGLPLTDSHHCRTVHTCINDGPLFFCPPHLPDTQTDRNGCKQGENNRGPPEAKAGFLVYH